MKRIAGSMVFLAILTGSAEPRDMVREVALVEQGLRESPTTISFTSEMSLRSVTIL